MLKDYSKAFTWFTAAAEQGVAEAQFELGRKFELGQGAEGDLKKAHHWYEESAKNGLAKGLFFSVYCTSTAI